MFHFLTPTYHLFFSFEQLDKQATLQCTWTSPSTHISITIVDKATFNLLLTHLSLRRRSHSPLSTVRSSTATARNSSWSTPLHHRETHSDRRDRDHLTFNFSLSCSFTIQQEQLKRYRRSHAWYSFFCVFTFSFHLILFIVEFWKMWWFV